ncbi:MAG: sigma-70 family RNA polymerase sigma factor [Calditrichaeota bacterium]|nr:sigma-70 family RNA polymerase sigma factor [Calditrichota bacterium]
MCLKLQPMDDQLQLPPERISNEEEDPLNPDADLIERSQAGDDAAFQVLVERYRSRVGSIAYQVLGNYEDARDVAQEVFIKLYRGIGSFDPHKKFFTWLYRLTVNASIDYLRAKRRRSYESSIDERPEQYFNIPSADSDLASHDIERRELRQLFIDLAAKLNPKQRAVFVLCDLQGFTADEVAEILNCPKVTLRWYLHEARRRIRIAIARDHPEYWRGKPK